MPPVFGPRSPSKMRLWSWLEASGRTFLPSTMTMKLASSPSMNSSMTTRCPASPSLLPPSIMSIASCASASVAATTTPLPAASPSALITIGAPSRFTWSCAAVASVKDAWPAVGIACRAMKRLANSLEASSCAAAFVGPKMRRPSTRSASTAPAASGASGPTTVAWMPSLFANCTRSGIAVWATLKRPSSRAVPVLPGATYTRETLGDCARRHAMACSRPPEPMTRSFMRRLPSPHTGDRPLVPRYGTSGLSPVSCSVPEVSHARENHRDAVLVGGGDHLAVAHAAAGLDHGARARRGDHVESVAKRKEGIGGHDRAAEREPGVLRLDRGDARGIHPAHLPRADPKRHAARTEHDGVGLHELRHAEGEDEVVHLVLRGVAPGDDAQLRHVIVVGSLHQQPSAHALHVQAVQLFRGLDRKQPHVQLRGEDLEGLGRIRGGDDDLDELLRDRRGSVPVDRAVEGDDAAEGRGGIGEESVAIGGERGIGNSGPARTGVLHDHAGGDIEGAAALPPPVRLRDVGGTE